MPPAVGAVHVEIPDDRAVLLVRLGLGDRAGDGLHGGGRGAPDVHAGAPPAAEREAVGSVRTAMQAGLPVLLVGSAAGRRRGHRRRGGGTAERA
ncbi:hypothetical protein ACFYXM_28845 [Streptomyces sp. NPDC002476]|uniref:hypothetical protein n=1 Tax=Streptomyces sp. NPDC002476 TaxID=3364648 RepID=UPI0036949263